MASAARHNLAKVEMGATFLDNGHLALLLAELVFRLELFKTLAPMLSIKSSAPALAIKDFTLSGQCGPAAQLHVEEACKLGARLTAVVRTTTFKSDPATLLPDLTVNGEPNLMSFIIEIMEETKKI